MDLQLRGILQLQVLLLASLLLRASPAIDDVDNVGVGVEVVG